ncbi:hypothetical protein [Deinococcus multiflagellatus]|uniref:Uncharacterized protein n=1 Tax=Deinococcus multiflagellatus TaxID=1656887 RepID=A0ABW1ZRV9_9DEIO|nr:hypothetical protein [Deinococcus multiflagellatus]MBZ9714385.1 hypothetical protein [Deinococcus multiflagellatus]
MTTLSAATDIYALCELSERREVQDLLADLHRRRGVPNGTQVRPHWSGSERLFRAQMENALRREGPLAQVRIWNDDPQAPECAPGVPMIPTCRRGFRGHVVVYAYLISARDALAAADRGAFIFLEP